MAGKDFSADSKYGLRHEINRESLRGMKNSFDLGSKMWWPPEEAAAQEFVQYSEALPLETCLAQFDQVAEGSSQFVSGNGTGTALRHVLADLIARQQPASLIRLGDADGNVLLNCLGGRPALNEYCLNKISSIYFGNKKLMLDEHPFFAETVIEAMRHADVIGGPERATIARSFNTPYPDLDVRGMCGMRGVYNHLAANAADVPLEGKIWTSTWFSRSLLPHYFSLLKGQKFVGLITCYEELGPLIQARTEAAEVGSLLVPMQASIANVHRDIRHYPEVFHDILDRIDPPYQGAVYIVAAGILSKPYCTRIKQRGGIAIDVGSVADIWMGTASRPGMRAEMVDKWRLT
ncbi:MAG: hypothetical protein K5Q68_09655 [Roseococcus sp.]|nr:hypothetical protein [Roseococcus sp.]